VTERPHGPALTGQVVVVTGGAGLIGRAFVQALASHGATVIVADRDLEAAARVAEGVRLSSPRTEGVALDITSPASVSSLITTVHARHGRIDAVVNNAYPRNRQYGRKLEDVEYADFVDNVGQHLGGYFLVAQQFALFFRTHGGGTIVNMASIYGTLPPRFDIYAGTPMTMPVEYAAIKAGVLQLTRYMAQYFKKDGIRVNAISPGGIADGQPAAFLERYAGYCGPKGMLDPGDICGALVFLLSDAGRYVNGQNLIVDDGFSL
jgi:NAD(P)-dependent dehydrogenase (short-subunit alcohol dehydrogenase family)